MSSNGEPGGNSNPGNGLLFVTTVWLVEILTTDGINFSAKSAKDPGTGFAFKLVKFKTMQMKNIFFRKFINFLYTKLLKNR